MPTVDVYFEGIKTQISHQLHLANQSIKIAVAWFTDEDLMTDLIHLKRKHKEAIDIQVIISNDNHNFENRSNLEGMVRAGIELRIMSHPFLHHKFCLIDDHTILNGSYNWTYKANSRNAENITVISVEPGEQVFTKFNAKFSFYTNDARSSIYSRAILPANTTQVFEQFDKEQIEIRKKFQQKINESVEAIRRINKPGRAGIRLDLIENMIADHGDGVNMVKVLIRKSNGGATPREGFIKLIDWGYPNLTFEHQVLETEFELLFSEPERTTCRKLLGR